MAMRENTGLQIALILFVMITVILSVSTYYFWNQGVELTKKADAADQRASEEQKTAQRMIAENETLRNTLGYKLQVEGGPDAATISANFDKDMTLFAPEYEEKDYRSLPEYLASQIVDLNQQVVKANERADGLMAQVEQARKEESTNTTAYLDASKKQADDFTTARVSFKTETDRVAGQLNEMQTAIDTVSRAASVDKGKLTKEIDALAGRVQKLNLLKDTLQRKVDKERPKGVTEEPDGKITWVGQDGGRVYINLGSADGLARGTTFSVLDVSSASVATADAKASIEVANIRGPHLAEARILDDSLSDPILTNDKIYSPVWSPGQKTHFALVGFMDIDGDGDSDRDVVRNLIMMNGGVVDAEVLDDGTRDGRVTINTRYLVQGARRDEKSKAEALQADSHLLQEAQDLGVEKMPVERLLADMGWRGAGGAADSGSKAAVRPQPKSARDAGSTFQPRTRPRGAPRGVSPAKPSGPAPRRSAYK